MFLSSESQVPPAWLSIFVTGFQVSLNAGPASRSGSFNPFSCNFAASRVKRPAVHLQEDPGTGPCPSSCRLSLPLFFREELNEDFSSPGAVKLQQEYPLPGAKNRLSGIDNYLNASSGQDRFDVSC